MSVYLERIPVLLMLPRWLSLLLGGSLLLAGTAIADVSSEHAEQVGEPCFTSPFLKSVCTQDNFEGSIPHPRWNQYANEKLTGFSGVGAKNQPNILIIYVDDMGWGDPGVYGGGPALGAPTPNIDKLAARGLRMTSAYSQPACTPTRAAWMTGRLPQRTGLTRPTAAGEESAGMAEELTIAEILRRGGYATGMAGKWHLGEAPGQWPTDVGYENYYGNLGVNTAYHDWRDKNFSPELVFDEDRVAAMHALDFIKTTVKTECLVEVDADGNDVGCKTKAGYETPEEINLETEPGLEKKYLDWSVSFMQAAASADEPFFLYHAMNRVHTKNHPNPAFEGKSPASTPFRDGMMEIDYVVGQLVKETRRLDAQNGTSTFIFFTSDNGAEEDVHAGGINTSDAGHHPWRGAKGTTWEGGVRVSAIASWPKMIQAGRVSDGLFDHMDLFNTLARLGKGDLGLVPEDHYIDGIDQTSWLLADSRAALADDDRTTYEDPQVTSNREAIYYWYGQDFYGVRWAEFKRLERIMNIGMSVGPQTYGGLFNATKSETSDPSMGWYFNLYSDPKERMPITRTWNIGTLNELSTHSKLTFVKYPQAPHGVILNGYILGGKAGGTVPIALLKEVLNSARITQAAMPD